VADRAGDDAEHNTRQLKGELNAGGGQSGVVWQLEEERVGAGSSVIDAP
jgi:hypothetical protein